jgi:hypothetical protein
LLKISKISIGLRLLFAGRAGDFHARTRIIHGVLFQNRKKAHRSMVFKPQNLLAMLTPSPAELHNLRIIFINDNGFCLKCH